jgi:hypothetical protein
MRVGMVIAIIAIIAAALTACERPWAKTPVSFGGAPACDGPPTVVTACDWARGFDDLIVFAIDGRRELLTPIVDNSFERNEVEDASTCRIVSNGLELYGYTETSVFGARPDSVLMSGDHESVDDGILAPGTRVLVGVIEASNFTPIEFARNPRWPHVSEDGIVTLDATECSDGAEVDGHTVDDVMRMVSECAVRGDLVDDPVVVGAVCFRNEQ